MSSIRALALCAMSGLSLGARTCDDASFLQPNIMPTPEAFVPMDDAALADRKGVRTVHVGGATYLRVAFDKDIVRASSNFRVQLKSTRDGHTQHLNATTLKQWGYVSAYFNGDKVEVRVLHGAAHASPKVAGAIAGQETGIQTICGPTDDRTSSSAARAARYMGSGGCSGWLIQDPATSVCEGSNFLTAGHCGAPASGGTMQFNVPLSSPTGSINHPGPEDQYSVDPESVQSLNSGVGFDWMYMGCFPNSETGLTAYEAQGDAYELTTAVPSVGAYIQKYGYGTTSPRDQYSQSQQFHGLPNAYVQGANPTTARYTIDTTGGDSGSAVEIEEGLAFAIHTHGGCQPDGSGSNAGTLLVSETLQAALASPQGICAPRKK